MLRSTINENSLSLPGTGKKWLLAAIALAAILPAQVFAQPADNCAADLSVDFNGDGPFYVGDQIPIRLDLSAAFSQGATYVDISHFQYLLDCSEDDTYPACTPQGNTVVLDENSVETTCTDAEGNTPAAVVTMYDGLVTVDFTVDEQPGPGKTSVQIPTPPNFGDPVNSCDVTFNVSVEALAPDNQNREIVELSGWGGTDAICDNEASATGVADSLQFAIANPQTVFIVTKDFTDNNPEEVHVFIQCNSGLPNQSDFWITDPATMGTWPYVGFVVTSIPSIGADCIVWEAPVPDGYDVTYTADAEPDAIYSQLRSEEDGCYFDDVLGGYFYCDVTNTLEETKVTVNKVWEGDVLESDISLVADVDWSCWNIRTSPGGPLTSTGGSHTFVGETDSYDITGIYADYAGTSKCSAQEDIVQSAVESDDSDCEEVSVPLNANPTPSCTIYNTVFFEGIPTLSQSGIALMALLMLGIGLLGFRRSV